MPSYFRFFLLLTLWASVALAAEPDTDSAAYILPEIHLITSRLPRMQAVSLRSVHLRSRRELEATPARSLAELLTTVPGVQVRQLGAAGVLGDLAIRGGSFEQTAVMIDGVKVNDPQTGHHNLNVPVGLSDVERVEVLNGPGSSLFGPNAFAGAVNFVTRAGERQAISGSVEGGEHGLWETRLALSQPVGMSRHRLSLSRARADGYTRNTEYAAWNGFYRGSIPAKAGTFELAAGYLDKDFGASSFYTAAFPHQHEATETRFAQLGLALERRGWSLTPRAWWRQHRDDYILDNTRPDWYRNRHRTDVAGAELQLTVDSPLGQTAAGGEVQSQAIISSSLKNHSRVLGGVFLEHGVDVSATLRATAGAFLYHYGEFGWQAWPDVTLAYALAPRVCLTASAGSSFRVPSFTELYYHDPGNVGNAALEPERALSYQLGVNAGAGALQVNAAVFRRESRDVIDWVKAAQSEPWTVRNIARMSASGVEAALGYQRAATSTLLARVTLGYMGLSTERDLDGLLSKNALVYLRHQITGEMELRLPFGLDNTWSARYLVREGYGDVALVDARLSRVFKQIEPYVAVSNLFDRAYMEIPSLPMPGRWLRGGILWEVGR